MTITTVSYQIVRPRNLSNSQLSKMVKESLTMTELTRCSFNNKKPSQQSCYRWISTPGASMQPLENYLWASNSYDYKTSTVCTANFCLDQKRVIPLEINRVWAYDRSDKLWNACKAVEMPEVNRWMSIKRRAVSRWMSIKFQKNDLLGEVTRREGEKRLLKENPHLWKLKNWSSLTRALRLD
jgi:hypothetical protein